MFITLLPTVAKVLRALDVGEQRRYGLALAVERTVGLALGCRYVNFNAPSGRNR